MINVLLSVLLTILERIFQGENKPPYNRLTHFPLSMSDSLLVQTQRTWNKRPGEVKKVREDTNGDGDHIWPKSECHQTDGHVTRTNLSQVSSPPKTWSLVSGSGVETEPERNTETVHKSTGQRRRFYFLSWTVENFKVLRESGSGHGFRVTVLS